MNLYFWNCNEGFKQLVAVAIAETTEDAREQILGQKMQWCKEEVKYILNKYPPVVYSLNVPMAEYWYDEY